MKDEKARKTREREGKREAGEAEEAARELGVWDEFYGSGKPSEKKKKGKNGKGAKEDGEEVVKNKMKKDAPRAHHHPRLRPQLVSFPFPSP